MRRIEIIREITKMLKDQIKEISKDKMSFNEGYLQATQDILKIIKE